jgi:hypothetical protein
VSTTLWPTTDAIARAFDDEIAALGGSIHDRYDDGSSLYVRAVLQEHDEVVRGDVIQAGVALRTVGPSILVNPYTLRLVCSNGAVVMSTERPHRARRVELGWAVDVIDAVLDDVRLLVRACAEPADFHAFVDRMRSATSTSANVLPTMAPLLAQLPPGQREAMLRMIMGRFERDEPTLYGVMNAVTAVARDTADPALRWSLEEIGGGLVARLQPSPRANIPVQLVLT